MSARRRERYAPLGFGEVSRLTFQLLESTIHYRQKLNNLDHLVDNNGAVCDKIAEQAMGYYQVDEAELAAFVREEEAAGRGPERISVAQALKHFVRDWAAEGLREREAAFPCVLETLGELHPDRLYNASTAPPRVLLPGAGLGRLGYEVASLGGKLGLRLRSAKTARSPGEDAADAA